MIAKQIEPAWPSLLNRETAVKEGFQARKWPSHQGQEALRLKLWNKTPRYGNDNDEADDLMRRVFDSLLNAIDGRPNLRGGEYLVDMLPTT